MFNAKMYLTEKPSATTGTRRSTRIAKKAAEVKAAEGKAAAGKSVSKDTALEAAAAAGAGKKNESPKLTRKQQKLYNQLIKNGVNNASARLMATMD